MSRIYGITNQGVSLIKKARKSGGKVTISRVLLSSQYEEGSVSELFGRCPHWYDLGEGTITGVSSSNALSVGISFPEEPQGMQVKSLAIFASYKGKEVMLYAQSDPNAAVILGDAPYSITVTASINASDVIDSYGDVDDLSALKQQIAGEYISQVSYDPDSGVMTFTSQDGTRQIDIELG